MNDYNRNGACSGRVVTIFPKKSGTGPNYLLTTWEMYVFTLCEIPLQIVGPGAVCIRGFPGDPAGAHEFRERLLHGHRSDIAAYRNLRPQLVVVPFANQRANRVGRYHDFGGDRKSTRLNSSHPSIS